MKKDVEIKKIEEERTKQEVKFLLQRHKSH